MTFRRVGRTSFGVIPLLGPIRIAVKGRALPRNRPQLSPATPSAYATHSGRLPALPTKLAGGVRYDHLFDLFVSAFLVTSARWSRHNPVIGRGGLQCRTTRSFTGPITFIYATPGQRCMMLERNPEIEPSPFSLRHGLHSPLKTSGRTDAARTLESK